MRNLPTNPEYNIYVGARYVPKLMGEWSNTVEYEPLSIVLYQGNSYTSRTFVPRGTLPTDTDYWALTGNYNAQIEQYRQEVKALQDNVDENTINIAALQEDFDNSDFIFVGDSYGDQSGEWTTNLQNKITSYIPGNHNFYNACVGGARFYMSSGTNTYLNNLQNIASKISKPNNVKYIILCGGYNDRNINTDNIYSAAQSFISYCRETYPNAKVYLGMIGWSLLAKNQIELINVATIYCSLRTFGFIYMPAMYSSLFSTNCFLDDKFHPNSTGSAYLGRNIYNSIFLGSSGNFISNTITPTVSSPFIMKNQPNIVYQTYEKICHVYLINLNITFTDSFTCDGTSITIYNLGDCPIGDTDGDVAFCIANARLYDSTHDIITTAIITLKEGNIILNLRYYENAHTPLSLNNGNITLYNCQMAIPLR